MIPFEALVGRIAEELSNLGEMVTGELLFDRRADAGVLMIALLSACAAALLVRGGRSINDFMALPSIFGRRVPSMTGAVRHVPLLVLVAGLPGLAIALAGPYRTLADEEVSHPGRRIALLLDASSSMLAPFPGQGFGAKAPNDAAFFTTVAAAQTFIRQRQAGRYRDLIALIEFGDEAYVVTPFTTDYDSVLLSASLIGDWGEFMQFPNQGTSIGVAIDRATGLFRAFDFAEAAGNVMVIFSDGQDTQMSVGQKPVSEILAAALAIKIPVYLIRTSRGKSFGDVVPDNIWKPAVESTGGRFYAAANEGDVLRAIRDIDRRSPGTIQLKRYTTNQPRFAAFVLAAAACWALAVLLVLTAPFFRTFP
jgi:hypothetical protein